MKRFYLVSIFVILALVVINIIVRNPAQAQLAPTQITNCQDLQNMNNNLSGNYQLANDIDCSDTKNWNGGQGFIPVGWVGNYSNFGFKGTLDGQGHKISNLFENPNIGIGTENIGIGTTNVSIGTTGLFTVINAGVVQNIKLENVSIKSQPNGCAGGLAGNVYSTQANSTIPISNIQVSGNISGDFCAGGLIGGASGVTVSQSFSTGTVSGTQYLGGLIGQNFGNPTQYSTISNSYSTANVIQLQNSIYGSSDVGGLVGENNFGEIDHSYAAGQVVGIGSTNVGGLVGIAIQSSTVSNSYWDTQITGQPHSAGSPDSAGYTTAQFIALAPFFNWDYANIWVADFIHYPILKWQEQSPIDLWNTFSASSQENIFEPVSPPNTINWGAIDIANAVGVNWTDLLVLSRPPVWNYPSATPTQGLANSVNWTYLGALTDTSLNWSDVDVMTKTGINWASVNPLVRSGVNWTDWLVAGKSGINWNDVLILSRQGINWNSIGTLTDSVNWTDLVVMSHHNINWKNIYNLSNENVNWDNFAILNEAKLSPINLNTLRTIGVSNNGRSPTVTSAQLTLNLTGNGTGVFTSSPAGINCTAGSGIKCSASFPLNQLVTLNFMPNYNYSIVSNWGGCTPTSSISCTVMLNQSLVVNIMLSPAIYTINASAGTGGKISPAGNINVNYGANQTFTITPNVGYTVNTVLIDKVAVKLTGNTYTFNKVTSTHTISASFSLVSSCPSGEKPIGDKCSPYSIPINNF